jgi:hypothetical protein
LHDIEASRASVDDQRQAVAPGLPQRFAQLVAACLG